ncbi:MAG: glucose-1-phosphate cytidylyltransferase [Thermoplasmatales archaeon]
MKVVILAGGFGTRISEETTIKPKPMVEIGGKPILWHIMKIYSYYGFNDFVICLGYKGYVIKEYFLNYYFHQSDIEIDIGSNTNRVINSEVEPWKVTLVETGVDTMTGGRLKRIKNLVNNEAFFATYGDGVSDINISELLKFHNENQKLATITAVQPPGRFGALGISEKGEVTHFLEKPLGDGSWINGGFFVLEPEVLDFIDSDKTVFEKEPLENLSKSGQLVAYRHKGFWQPMDTLREKNLLNNLWNEGKAPWKIWND